MTRMTMLHQSLKNIMTQNIVIFLLCFYLPVFSSPVPCGSSNGGLQTRLLHQFPKPSWLENIAIQRNGSILVTEMSQPHLYQINPFKHDEEPRLVHEFPGYLGALGIAEIEDDVFAVITGNFSLELTKSFPGTYALWKVDFREDTSAESRVSKLADVPQASFLNGMGYLPKPANSLLISDSTLGLVFRHNLTTSKTDIAVQVPLMAKASPNLLEGINGLKIHDGAIYFTNGFTGLFCRLPINPDGSAKDNSQGEVVSRTSLASYTLDDMAISSDGTTYVAVGNENAVMRVAPNGVATIIAGNLNSSAIVEPTSMALGRTKRDANTLYVTTGGGLGAPFDGTTTVGAQLVAVQL